MKGIVLAGGNGTRLLPLTKITNKHLVAVYDKPMIEYPLKTLIDMGINDILIISGREHAGSFVNYLGSGQDRNVRFTYKVQENAGGIAAALLLAEDFVAGDDMAVILGDNYFDGYLDLPPMKNSPGYAFIVLKQVDDPQRFGVYTTGSGIEEKPKDPKSNLAVTGLYFYPNDVFDVIRTQQPSARGEMEITDVNNYYFRKRSIGTTEFTGFWSDMGTPDSLAKTIKHLTK